jgi:hypothetical protein
MTAPPPDPEPVPHVTVREFDHVFEQVHQQLGMTMPSEYPR